MKSTHDMLIFCAMLAKPFRLGGGLPHSHHKYVGPLCDTRLQNTRFLDPLFLFTLLFVCVVHSLHICVHQTAEGDFAMCIVLCMVRGLPHNGRTRLSLVLLAGEPVQEPAEEAATCVA